MKHVKQKIEGIAQNIEQRHRQGNGLLNKKGGHLSKPELHAVAIPVGFISSSYMLPEPLGLISFASFFLMWRNGFKLTKDQDYHGHWNDVIDESAYSAISMAATIAFWKYHMMETIGVEQVNGLLLKILLGA